MTVISRDELQRRAACRRRRPRFLWTDAGVPVHGQSTVTQQEMQAQQLEAQKMMTDALIKNTLLQQEMQMQAQAQLAEMQRQSLMMQQQTLREMRCMTENGTVFPDHDTTLEHMGHCAP